YVMVDRKRKLPATTFMRCFGQMDDEQIVNEFFKTTEITLDDFSKGASKVTDLVEKFLGNEFIEEVIDPETGKLLVQKGAKVTKKATEALKSHGVKEVHLNVAVGYEHLIGRILGQDVVDQDTGEILSEVFERI